MGRNKRRGKGRIVDDRRQPVPVRDVGDLPVVGHVVLGVAGGFDIDGPGVLVDQLAQGLRLAGIEEPHFDTEFGKGLREKGPRSAVEAGGRDEVLSRVDDGQQRGRDRRLAAGKGQPRRAAVERRKPLFQHVGRGVHQPRVDIAELAQAEEVRRMFRVVKDIARRGVDRHGAGGRGGIGRLAGVQCQGADTRGICLFSTHGMCFSKGRAVVGMRGAVAGAPGTPGREMVPLYATAFMPANRDPIAGQENCKSNAKGSSPCFRQRFLVNFIRSRRKMDRTPDFAVLLRRMASAAACGYIGRKRLRNTSCSGP